MTYACLSMWEQTEFPLGWTYYILYEREKKTIKLSKNARDVYNRENNFLF